MSRFNNDYEETINKLYKEYSDEIINLLVYEGILYEYDCGFGGRSMSKECKYIESHLKDDGFDVNLCSYCYLSKAIEGDTLYYIFNSNIYDYESAKALAKERYLKNNEELF